MNEPAYCWCGHRPDSHDVNARPWCWGCEDNPDEPDEPDPAHRFEAADDARARAAAIARHVAWVADR